MYMYSLYDKGLSWQRLHTYLFTKSLLHPEDWNDIVSRYQKYQLEVCWFKICSEYMGHHAILLECGIMADKQQTNIINRFFIQIKNMYVYMALLRKVCSRNTPKTISLKYKSIV